jgi:membrane associated rhomboid family serine protease
MASFNSKSIFQFASKSDIIKIITATSLFFVILQFTRITFLINGESDAPFYQYIYNKLALPATFRELLYQPWSLITYLFSELNFMRILGNMIWLWVFATVIEDLRGSNRILPIYLTGGVIGGLFMMLFNQFKPAITMSHYTGSLGALAAVAFATLIFRPKYKFSMFFGLEIPIWVFVGIFFALNIATIQSHTVSQLFLAIGGSLVGLGYTNILQVYFEKCTEWFTRIGNYFTNNDNFVTNKKNTNRQQTMLNVTYKKTQNKTKTIDDILDKIHEKGMDSLNPTEKQLLEEYSKNA